MRAQEFVKNLDEVSMGVSEFNVAIEQGTAILAEQQLDELLDLDTISDIGNALPNFIHKLVHVYATEATETVHTARLLIDKLLSGEPLSPEEKIQIKEQLLDIIKLIAVKVVGKILTVKYFTSYLLSAIGINITNPNAIAAVVGGASKGIVDKNITTKISNWLNNSLGINLFDEIFNALKTSSGKEYDELKKQRDSKSNTKELNRLYRQHVGSMI